MNNNKRNILISIVFAISVLLTSQYVKAVLVIDNEEMQNTPVEVVIDEEQHTTQNIECPVDANYSSQDEYATYRTNYSSPDNLKAFVKNSLVRMVDIDSMLVNEGLYPRPRIRLLADPELDEVATYIANAARQYPDTYATAVGLIIIAGYETNYRNESYGDCRTYTQDIDGSYTSHHCATPEERSNRENYIACGPTQVLSNRSMRLRNRPSCSDLINPEFAYPYTAQFINRFDYSNGHWNISGYSGVGAKAQRFEAKFNRILDILIDQTY
jgi:hypothetical protein